jgi:hypothetical protein
MKFLVYYGYCAPGGVRTKLEILDAQDLHEALVYAHHEAESLLAKRGQAGSPEHGAYPLDDLLQPGHQLDLDFYCD